MILKCLAAEPADRFARATDVVEALEGVRAFRAPPRRGRRRGLAWGIGAGLALLAGVLGYRFARPQAPPEPARPARPVEPRRAIAVLGFRDLGADPGSAWLKTALAEMISTELASGERLRVVSGEDVARARDDLALPDADGFAKETLTRIRGNLGSDVVVVGSFLVVKEKAADRIRLDVKLQDTERGETLTALTETGTAPELLDLVSRTAEGLRRKLGAGGRSAQDTGAVNASVPSRPAALRPYAEGLARLRAIELPQARALLEEAVAADPDFPLAHAALADALLAMGYESRGKDEAEKALSLAGSLSRRERLAVEARAREAGKEWSAAAEIYRTLQSFFPDDLEYGLRRAAAQRQGQRAKDALQTIQELRALPPPMRDDPRIDLEEAYALDFLSDFKKVCSAAERAIEKGEKTGRAQLVAEARLSEGWALHNLAEPRRAREMVEEGRRSFLAAGNRDGVARATNTLGNLLLDAGDLEGARKHYQAALEEFQRIGKLVGVGTATNNLAVIAENQGRLSEARRFYETAVRLHRETGQKGRLAETLLNESVVLGRMGQPSAALKQAREALALSKEIGQRRTEAVVIENLAAYAVDMGDLAEGESKQLEAIALWKELGNRSWEAQSVFGLAEIRLFRGDLAEARRLAEESLATRRELGEAQSIAESRQLLAEIAVAADDPGAAKAHLDAAIAEFEKEKSGDSVVRAETVRVEALLALGDVPGARRAADRAAKLIQRSEARVLAVRVKIADARVRAAEGNRTGARAALRESVAECVRMGDVALGFTARLALLEVESSGGDARTRANLQEVFREAEAKGFGLVARRAAKLSGAPKEP